MKLIDLKLGTFEVYLHTNAKHPWTYFKRHTKPYYTHVLWGKFSLIYGPYSQQTIRVCAECTGTEEIQGSPCGDGDYLDVCPSCRTVEGRTEEITLEEYERRIR